MVLWHSRLTGNMHYWGPLYNIHLIKDPTIALTVICSHQCVIADAAVLFNSAYKLVEQYGSSSFS
jgi:hypothetical protein